ncbi:dynamin family protein [Bacillus spongiae]|uniref:Dynamin family protein n=1 Tax=Bacillus spongiae TaxID=2683610 RepID=A0ABU8HDI4_9BACI
MIKSSEQQNLLNKTVQLYQLFDQHGDKKRTEKTKLLSKKIYKGEWVIAFCGHFSAGKSTMINELTGEKLLPSSPIPTSANLVKIHKSKEEFTKIHYHDQVPILVQGDYDSRKIMPLCKSGDKVELIEIGHQDSQLPLGVTVLDTPGVDSTDEAHMLATESALHLADVIFYVVDYNHVQSHVNFRYTKELIEKGASVHLIVNQVDKHNEEELSFEDFQQSVRQSFAAWGVELTAVFYTSLKKHDHPFNEFPTLQQFIQKKMAGRVETADQTIEKSIRHLIVEHEQWLEEQYDERVQPFVEKLTHKDWEKKENIVQQYIDWQKHQSGESIKVFEEQFNAERKKIIKNAYLMPFENRKLAEDYLASIQKDFKVGFLFSKGKTEEERARRLKAFHSAVQETVVSQLDWHLRTFCHQQLKNARILDESIMVQCDKLEVIVTVDMLKQAEKRGAQLSGEYVLTYCEELAGIISKEAEKETNNIKASMVERMQEEFNLTPSEEVVLKAQAFNEIDREKKHLYEKQEALKNANNPDESILTDYVDTAVSLWVKEEEGIRQDLSSEGWEKEIEADIELLTPSHTIEREKQKDINVDKIVDRLSIMGDEFIQIPGFHSFAKSIKEKANRLKNRNYTIALFGAFSAGKSSFANALLGEKALPVSPNPTTATINRIRPIGKHDSNKAVIYFKSEHALLEELNQSLSMFSMKVNTFEEAQAKIPLISMEKRSGVENTHISFLQAFNRGIKNYQNKLGKSVEVNLKTYEGYAANEEQSCFVDVIDVYIDNQFTNQGITLVDTPGADSINARHTDVAFQYIKDADMILFVTYYNHAFSKADREFLIQLGRVKDTFEMDKMFFIVNAIDLASSEEEEQEVMQYVGNQLNHYGIRSPQLFGISSLRSLDEKLEGKELNEQMGHFQQSFDDYLTNGLTKVTIDSANSLWKKGLSRLSLFIDGSKKTANEREIFKDKNRLEKQEVLQLLKKQSVETLYPSVEQEVEELLLYVHQRVFFRFSDFFKETFHPSLFVQYDGKTALQVALNELIEATAFDLAQELRATSVRIEKVMIKSLQEKIGTLHLNIKKVNDDLVFSDFEWEKVEIPLFTNAKELFMQQSFSFSLKLFKGTKRFFEQNEKVLLKESLQSIVSPVAKEYLHSMNQVLTDWSKAYLTKEFTRYLDETKMDLSDQFKAWDHSLHSETELPKWELLLKKLEGLDDEE